MADHEPKIPLVFYKVNVPRQSISRRFGSLGINAADAH